MRRWLIGALVIALVIGALPLWNHAVVLLKRPQAVIVLPKSEVVVRTLGLEIEQTAQHLNAYADQNDWNWRSIPGTKDAPYDIEVVMFSGLDMLRDIPGAVTLCGTHCRVDDDTTLSFVSLAQVSWFSSPYKAVFVNLEALQVNCNVSGERFDCMIERINLETRRVVVLEDPCEGLYTHGTTKLRSKSSITLVLFPFSI